MPPTYPMRFAWLAVSGLRDWCLRPSRAKVPASSPLFPRLPATRLSMPDIWGCPPTPLPCQARHPPFRFCSTLREKMATDKAVTKLGRDWDGPQTWGDR
jgi:hypothetical protein